MLLLLLLLWMAMTMLGRGQDNENPSSYTRMPPYLVGVRGRILFGGE